MNPNHEDEGKATVFLEKWNLKNISELPRPIGSLPFVSRQTKRLSRPN